MDKQIVKTIYRIEGGILNGTELEPFLFAVLVRYPHRKSPDCYIPPTEANGKKVETWHCCQENCPNPDFEGGIDILLEHLMIHKGRLLKPWNKRQQLKSPMPAVKLPPNPWDDKPKMGVNEDRRFCLDLYIADVERCLRKQGLEILKPTPVAPTKGEEG